MFWAIEIAMIRKSIVTAVIVCIASATTCLAQTDVRGQVFSPTPCHLAPKDQTVACIQMVKPVKGEITFSLNRKARKNGRKLRRVKVTVDGDGNFEETFKRAGQYTVTFKPQGLDGSSLVISPSEITVKSKAGTQDTMFVVAHKSYGRLPATSIASGCTAE